jgi:hypothetical protein
MAGDRFPWMQLKLTAGGPVEDLFQQLDDTRFNLLVMGQAAPAGGVAGFGDLVSVHAIPDDPVNAKALEQRRLSGPAFYLLRPDGHVGLAGTRLDMDSVKRYLADHHVEGRVVGAAARSLRAAA